MCWSYSIVEDSVTYEFGGNTVSSYTGYSSCDEDCFLAITNCNNNSTQCPTVSQTVPCHKLEFPVPSNACNCPNYRPDSINAICTPSNALGYQCQFFDNDTILFHIDSSVQCDIANPPCDSTCCYFFDCGDCSQCKPRLSLLPFHQGQEIEVETTCGEYSPGQCCLSYPATTLDVVWA